MRGGAVLARVAGAAAAFAGRVVAGWSGAAAAGCVTAGVYLLAGVGWALVAAGAFLMAIDYRRR